MRKEHIEKCIRIACMLVGKKPINGYIRIQDTHYDFYMRCFKVAQQYEPELFKWHAPFTSYIPGTYDMIPTPWYKKWLTTKELPQVPHAS